MKSLYVYIFIILVSLFPLLDIFKTEQLPHTSDGAMHVIRFGSYYKELIAGQFPVRWASQFNYGYGMPFFNFFHPLPYIVSVPLVALGFHLVTVLKISFLLTYILAGVFMLAFAKTFFKNEKTALLVAIMYQFAPFRLVEMHVRGSLGSLYAYMMLPAVLYALVTFLQKKTYFKFVVLVLSTSLLIMTHNIVGSIFLGFTILLVPFVTQKIKQIVLIYTGLGLGLIVTSFYLLPSVIEHKYTYGYLLTKDLFYQHFPPLINFFLPNITNEQSLRIAEVSIQIGLFHVMTLILMGYIVLKKGLNIKQKIILAYLLLATLGTLYIMQPISLPLWEKIPILRQFQFPWRFLSLINVTTALGSFVLLSFSIFQKKVIYFGLLIAVVISTIYYWIPYQGYQFDQQEYFWNYPRSTNYFGEINSIWMAGEPTGFPEKKIAVVSGPATISNISLTPTKHQFTVESTTSATIVDHTQFYPGWKVTVDTQDTPIQFQDQNYRGLITFPIPPGRHSVAVRYGENKLQLFSDVITITTLLLLASGFLLFRNNRYAQTIFNS